MNPFTQKTTEPMAVLTSVSRILLLQLIHCLKSVSCNVNCFVDPRALATNTVSRNSLASRCIVMSYGTSLSGYALLDALRTAADDFDAK
jgi:hypothetical protein